MKKLLLLLMLMVLAGCMAAFEPLQPVLENPEHKKTTSFQIGQPQEATIGESMVTEEDIFFYNGLVATADYQINPRVIVKKGAMLRAKGILKNGDKVYQVIDGERPSISGGDKTPWDHYCIAVNSSLEAYGSAACTMYEIVLNWPAPVKFLSPEKVYDKGTMKLELIYNGKSQDTIKLSYREYNEDMARPAFYQDVSYDLSESKTIGFKKMKIEVLEATNSSIKFIVNSTMQ